MRVKICGITNYEDAKISCDAGVDALGFVTYDKSPRFIKAEEIKKIIKKLPPFVVKAVLFVNTAPEYVNEVMAYTKADIAQIHFDANKEFFKKLNCKYLKVIRAKEKKDIEKFSDEYRIVDAYVPEYGGSGKRVALEWFEGRDNSKIILAGGLTPENVFEAGHYGFYGVDVSSGVESVPGKKDKKKVRRFVEMAKYGIRCG
ncbi:phosphoribosylanthranilate isomerase [Lebetimonas natsushimae]|uniref:N-(5'-phosphoribosyl)anthranilate isomerase n=1 Tax=Lebetimonas natsushimae TaxID=1936991 RepID=A0A292YBY6_9BACT|nr:phosphoribosylanthranilate isomerase [Lebetimonas natsushimae]GAX86940.1 phosphoribosylanthranilate isomerase [Lebetimonas natsushimae]